MDPENRNTDSRQNSAKSVKPSDKHSNTESDNAPAQNNTENGQKSPENKSIASRQNSAKSIKPSDEHSNESDKAPTQNNTENNQKSQQNSFKTERESPPNTAKSANGSRQNSVDATNNMAQNSTEPEDESRQKSAMGENPPDDNSSEAIAAPIQNSIEDEKTQSTRQNPALMSERESRQNSARTGLTDPNIKSQNNSRQTSAISTELPYLDTERKRAMKEDSRMYSPDDALTIDEFMQNLQADNLQLTKELEEWRDKYGVRTEREETENILAGKPSLKGLGLNDEEEKIASIVVKSKMSELGKMSTHELVDYVRLSSY